MEVQLSGRDPFFHCHRGDLSCMVQTEKMDVAGKRVPEHSLRTFHCPEDGAGTSRYTSASWTEVLCR